jgi:hypothetical protein
MRELSSAKRLANYSFLTVFANDDAISLGELHMLEKIALEDGEIHDDERVVLQHIFDRANMDHMDDETKLEIAEFRAYYNI